jgi:phage terminase Nu1 subunit (DNA packaging protein)
VKAENSRVSTESARMKAENSRVSAESARVTAEQKREAAMAEAVEKAKVAVTWDADAGAIVIETSA